MADVRVKISSTDLALSQQIVPVIWDSVLAWKKGRDARNYTQNPKSEMVLPCAKIPGAWAGGGSAAFDLLVAAESDCNTFDVSVEVNCGGVWSEVWAGSFTSQEWKNDRVKKIIQFSPKGTNYLDCLKDKWKLTQNVWYVLPTVTVRPYLLTYETHEETDQVLIGEPCDAPPALTDWCLYDQQQVWDDTTGNQVCVYFYHRYIKEGTCSGVTPIEPDTYTAWTLLDDNCPTSSDWWTCPKDARVPFTFRGGRRLDDVLEYLFSHTDCALSVKSDFFNINPDATAPSNSAYTAAAAKYHDLVIFQKSDVKRPDATNQATTPAFQMKLFDLLNDLKIMFNLDWQITEGGTVFRLEHVSYFAAAVGNDYTTAAYKKQLEVEAGEVPYLNKFQYRDENCTNYFKGVPIIFYCGEDEKEVRLNLFSCDVYYISDDNQAEHVGDDGFVLMATVDVAGTLYNVDNNRPMSWAELHDNFHKYNMPGAGEINGLPVTPLSVRPIKTQPEFSVQHCCDDTFDPLELHTTSLGDGEVQEAAWTIQKDILALELKY